MYGQKKYWGVRVSDSVDENLLAKVGTALVQQIRANGRCFECGGDFGIYRMHDGRVLYLTYYDWDDFTDLELCTDLSNK